MGDRIGSLKHVVALKDEITSLKADLAAAQDEADFKRIALAGTSKALGVMAAERDALRTLLKGVRDSLHCTKQAPFSYDANHHCSYCGTRLEYSKDAIDAALAAKEKP